MIDERDAQLLQMFSALPSPAGDEEFVQRVLERVRHAQTRRLHWRVAGMVLLLLLLVPVTPALVQLTLVLARSSASMIATVTLQPYDSAGWVTAMLVGLLFLRRTAFARR